MDTATRNERILAILREQTEKRIALGPEACRAHLIEIGYLNPDGTEKEYDHEEFLRSNHPDAFRELGILGS